MDATTQIKNNLISRIKSSKDLGFLKALQTIFDVSEKELYQLTLEQENSILKGRDQIDSGQFTLNESVISEMKGWLNEK